MKKLLLFAVVILFAACSEEESSSSMVKKAISVAEQNVSLEESPSLGAIPALQLQYKEADKQVKVLLEEFAKKSEEEFKKGGSMEDAIRANMILDDLKKETKEELESIYKEKIMAEAGKLDGKALTVEFDKEQFTSISAVLHTAADSSINKPFNIVAELTLAKPLPYTDWSWSVEAMWEYLDADGKNITAGNKSIKDFKKYKAGDVVTVEIKPTTYLVGEKAMKFAKMSFRVGGY